MNLVGSSLTGNNSSKLAGFEQSGTGQAELNGGIIGEVSLHTLGGLMGGLFMTSSHITVNSHGNSHLCRYQ
jgi:hypothetical protein